MDSENKKKYIIVGSLLVVSLAVVVWSLTRTGGTPAVVDTKAADAAAKLKTQYGDQPTGAVEGAPPTGPATRKARSVQ